MTVYYGVVKGNTVILPKGVDLRDGDAVEVQLIEITEDERSENLFELELLDRGLLSEIKPRLRSLPEGDRTPVEVEGEPLSETIIRERR